MAESFGDWLGVTERQTGPFGFNSYNGNGLDYTGRVQQAQGFDPTQQNQARGGQQGLGDMLNAASQGLGPSAAQAQFAQNSQQAQQMARGMFNQNRGAGGALNSYYANQNAAFGAQNAAAQAAALRAQEMQQARAQYGQVLNEQRGGDLQYGQLENQRNLQNASQFNQVLANAQAEANQLRAQQNAQIAEQERLRQKANYDARNGFADKLEKFGFGAASAGGEGGFAEALKAGGAAANAK